MAEHLFYLLYRLDPAKMKKRGFSWSDVLKFSEMYGTVERTFLLEEGPRTGNHNVTCRGHQLGSVKTKPGISPRVFTDLLLDCAVFLDLTDMSKYLPKLKEQVVTVPVYDGKKDEDLFEMYCNYNHVIDHLQCASKDDGGFALMSKMLQFSLSYLDKPFGEEQIISPVDGSVVTNIKQYPNLWKNRMLKKEEKLVELVRSELSEGRKCVVFAE